MVINLLMIILDRMRNATYGEGVNITPPAGKNLFGECDGL